MEREKAYYVCLVTNRSGTLYRGVTSDRVRRVYEHKHGLMGGFTARYRMDRLVYYEGTSSVNAAITREKQIKGWLRKRKIALIASTNPQWEDLSYGWLAPDPAVPGGLQKPDASGAAALRMTDHA